MNLNKIIISLALITINCAYGNKSNLVCVFCLDKILYKIHIKQTEGYSTTHSFYASGIKDYIFRINAKSLEVSSDRKTITAYLDKGEPITFETKDCLTANRLQMLN